jgi:hypothetical protein
MSRINYRRTGTWKIRIRKPVSIRPPKPMELDKYDRQRTKQELHELLKEVCNDTREELSNDSI